MELKAHNPKEAVFLSKLAQQCGQNSDTLLFIGPIIEKPEDLTLDERCLVSVAFKTLLDEKRASWNTLSDLESDPEYELVKEKITIYKKKVENELKAICQKAIKAIDSHLLKKAETAESKVFFLKLKGDYYRYMAEVSTGSEFEDTSGKAHDTYLSAKKIASEGLDVINPVRLGLALNLSVFLFEIKKNPTVACQIAKSAFDEATSGMSVSEDDQYKDSTYIMQMIKDNLTSWTSDVSEPDDSSYRGLSP